MLLLMYRRIADKPYLREQDIDFYTAQELYHATFFAV